MDRALRRWQKRTFHLWHTQSELYGRPPFRLTPYVCKKNSFAEFIYMREITKKLHSFEYNNTTPNPVTRKNKHPQATSLSFGSKMLLDFFLFFVQSYCSPDGRQYSNPRKSLFCSKKWAFPLQSNCLLLRSNLWLLSSNSFIACHALFVRNFFHHLFR